MNLKVNLKTLLAAYLTICSFFVSASTFAKTEPTIRILIAENLDTIILKSMQGLLSYSLPELTDKSRIIDDKQLVISTNGNNLFVNSKKIAASTVYVLANGEEIEFDNKRLRKELRVILTNQGQLKLVNVVEVEKYIAGLINSEISTSWPKEVIKAQTVAARTYAMYQIMASQKSTEPKDYDVKSTVLDQVYEGSHKEDVISRDVVLETRGQYLTKGGKVIETFYHSSCGGVTESASNVWNKETIFTPVTDQYCERSPRSIWSHTVTMERFKQAIKNITGNAPSNILSIVTTKLSDSPRKDLVIVEDSNNIHTISAKALREELGFSVIKSTWFEIQLNKTGIIFHGRGYGHGVGLCQWGAKKMAELGFDYRAILKHYYPDTDLISFY